MMGKIDVWDLDISIANYIYKGIKQYIKENDKAVFPTAPTYDDISNDELKERVNRWHIELNEVANKFKKLSDYKYHNITENDVNDAFDSLKGVYFLLCI